MEFYIEKHDPRTKARTGFMRTPRGEVETPAFFPVGTYGVVKTLSSQELLECSVQGILCNTYHLFLRPGQETIKKLGGLHRFMNWPKTIITDSGGYQVFSISLLKDIQDLGVSFQSPVDGRSFFLTPEKVVDIQVDLGSDIIMVLDECVGFPVSREYAAKAVKRTVEWAKRSKQRLLEINPQGCIFGIIQGSTYKELRELCQDRLLEIGFHGYAVGGLGIGEPLNLRRKMLYHSVSKIPLQTIRYLMGIGKIPDILEAVAQGYDLFDCIIPTRFGRTGTALTSKGKVVIRNAQYAQDSKPLDSECHCKVCQHYSRGYLRYLFNIKESLGMRLVSYHNVYFYMDFMKRLRQSIREGRFEEFSRRYKDLEF